MIAPRSSAIAYQSVEEVIWPGAGPLRLESSASKLGNHPVCLRFDADDLNAVLLKGCASTCGSKHFFNGLLPLHDGSYP